MFHIVFNANDNYVKYLSVLITSIVKNTDSKKKFQAFFEDENLQTGGGGVREI